MSLSQISIILGLIALAAGIYGLMKPDKVMGLASRFPRAIVPGWILMGVSTLWFLYNFQNEDIADFAAYKNFMLLFFLAIGVGSIIYVRDFLSVRGLAVFVMLLAHAIVEAGRWLPTSWRLVMIIFAYLLVVCGIIWTVQPYRLRDWIQWATATPTRFRNLQFVRIGFGVLLIVLGATVYRAG